MPAGVIHLPDDEDGKKARQSSQIESVAQAVEGPSLRTRKGGPTNYKECSDVETRVSSTIDETGYESTGSDEDIPSKKAVGKQKRASRKSRPQSTKQTAEDAEQQTKQTRVVLKSKKRSCDDDQLEPQQSAKRGRRPSTATEMKDFEKHMRVFLDKYGSKAQEVASLRLEKQDLKIRGEELESKLEKAQQAHKKSHQLLKQDINRLQDEVQELQDEVNELEYERDKLDADSRRWKRELIAALDKNRRDDSKYVKVTDSHIMEAWMMLSYNVRDLVAQCLTEKPSNQDELLASLAKPNQLLSPSDIPYLRVNILRKAIWRQLVSAVFQGKQPIWQGILGQFLTQHLSGKDHASIADPRYLKIISQTKSTVIADLVEEGHLDLKAVDAQVDIAWKRLNPFIPTSAAEDFIHRMKKLIAEAVELHATLMKSKAIFVVKWTRDHNGTDSVTYDPSTMETISGDAGADATKIEVKFVEAPGMMKIGNADGHGFEHNMMLCKSVVILEEVEDEETSGNDYW
ncbi:hypothetical protein TgHK011_006584 [Trichoderma gracile]|nr:hypothetical protein TgHK011_006584 [Trichoderma gracile]